MPYFIRCLDIYLNRTLVVIFELRSLKVEPYSLRRFADKSTGIRALLANNRLGLYREGLAKCLIYEITLISHVGYDRGAKCGLIEGWERLHYSRDKPHQTGLVQTPVRKKMYSSCEIRIGVGVIFCLQFFLW
jgi:hypothetical protein